MTLAAITENTRIPLKWAGALLVGCATFTTIAYSAGSYFGAGDAQATALEARVSKLESAVEKIPQIAEGVARLEGAMGTLPERKRRSPAGGGL